MLEADPQILVAAEKLFTARGYHAVMMADVAREANIALPAVQTHFADKASLLAALMDQYSPQQELRTALLQLSSDTPQDMLRGAMQRFIEIFGARANFAKLAIIDIQVNQGAYIEAMFRDIASDAASFINRLSTMPGVRPVSSIMLARTLAALVIGFVVTQQLAPENAQFTMRVMPTKAWVDGISDILLHGILDD